VPVDFVGSKRAPYVDPGYTSSSYADPNFDQDHFARFGEELREMVNPIAAEVRTQQPDVIVLEAGINDFRHHQGDSTIVQTTENYLRSWVDRVRGAKPDTRIIISPVLQVDSAAAPVLNPLVRRFDADLPGIANDLSTAESPITVAATNVGWSPSGPQTWDGLHPSSTGEAFIAQRIAEALHRVHLLPGTPPAYRAITWPRIERPLVKLSGRRATVSWDRQAVGAGRLLLQRVGQPAVISKAFYRGGHQVVAVAPGATYNFRVQVRRGKMIGRWGPVLRMRVAAPQRPTAPARVTVGATGIRWTASPRAASYVVAFHKAHQKRWTVRRTTKRQLLVRKVTVAKVRAVNAGGTSAWRVARR
jgi:lysophospholipase L1-like esterase